VVARPCEERWELDLSLFLLCVAPLRLGGLRGKKSTPSVGWEVPVRYRRLASREVEGVQVWDNDFGYFSFGYGMHV
jgi:hypothetical protein